MEIQVLGPVELRSNGAEVPVGGPRQRRLLAALVVNAGKVVSVDRLIDAVWAGEEPPDQAANTMRTYVSRLRATLGDGLDALDGFATDRRSQRMLIELSGIVATGGRGERDPRFDRFAAEDFESLPWNALRLAAVAMAGAAAAGLRDTRAAAVLEALLEPYHGQLLIMPPCCLVFDAADGLRGELLTLLGRHDEAVACLEAAAALCERARVVPNAIRTSHRLARALASRNGPGDSERARRLAADAFEGDPARHALRGQGHSRRARRARVA